MGYLVFNMNPRSRTLPAYKRDWFSKKEFRQAVSYALDRRSMIQTVGRGIGRPEWSPVTEANRLFYNPKVRRYPHDPARAKALLRRLGFADRKHDGILEDAAGHELAFTLIAGTGNSAVATICSIIQDDLKQVGMKVTVSLMEYQALLSRRDRYDWECNLNGWSGDPEPHRSQTIWLSSGRAHFWNPLQSHPATLWEAEIDRIYARAAQETNYTKRKALYDRWQAIIAEQQPLIFLTTPDVLGAIRNRVRNVRPTSLSGLLWNLDELAI
jgi:peptide/nickel transport system substrate-binding protein